MAKPGVQSLKTAKIGIRTALTPGIYFRFVSQIIDIDLTTLFSELHAKFGENRGRNRSIAENTRICRRKKTVYRVYPMHWMDKMTLQALISLLLEAATEYRQGAVLK